MQVVDAVFDNAGENKYLNIEMMLTKDFIRLADRFILLSLYFFHIKIPVLNVRNA